MKVEIPDSAEYVKAIRRDCGMTQAEFAAAIGISVRTLQKYELGVNKPGYDAMFKLEAMKKEKRR